MTLQKLMGYARRAVDDYAMIADGDTIAVGLSGGKDSMSLLLALHAMRDYYPLRYELTAVTVALGFTGEDISPSAALCERLGVKHVVAHTDIGRVVFDDRREKNPCALCAKMRRGALHSHAAAAGCNKVALGHNRDDVIQTFFLSMFYEGRIHTFSPVTYLDRKGLTLIRPLIYTPEKEIVSFVRKHGVATAASVCPVDGHTKRADIKQFIREQSKKYRGFETKMLGQIQRLPIDGWGRGTT